MGVFDFLKRNRKNQNEVRSIINNYYNGDYKYFVWNYANNIYDIPEVRTAIEKISKIFSSMPIYHKRVDKKGFITYLEDKVQRVLFVDSNPLQNGTQFFEEAINKLLLNNNLFIEPIFDNLTGELIQIYNLPFKNFTFELSKSSKDAYVTFHDNNELKVNMKGLIYLSRFVGLGGGSRNSLGLYETVLKSLGEKIVNDADPNKPRALLQSTSTGMGAIKEKDVKGTMQTAKTQFDENVYGIGYIDKGWSITPINWQENEVNKNLMQFIIEQVYTYFSINENIIKDKASEIEMAMFVRNTIQPLAMMFEKEFTRKLFTINEYNFGHRIEFDYNTLIVTTSQQKTNLAQAGLRNGIFNIDEVREMFGYSPLENGLGSVYRTSADLVNIKVVDEYQLGKVDKSVDENKTATTMVSATSENVDDIKNEQKEVNDGTES